MDNRIKTERIQTYVDPASREEPEQSLVEPGLGAGKVPNAVTREALRAADAGENLTRYDSVDAMFRDLGV